MTPYVGEIILVPYNFAPRNYAFCNGQLLAIVQNTALFSLLGTMYGGDGKSTFALPNLNGMVAIGHLQGQGLTERFLGETAGSETVTLVVNEMPAHAHGVTVNALTATPRCSSTTANSNLPAGRLPAVESSGVTATYHSEPPDASMRATNPMTLSGATGSTGGGQPHSNMQPYLVLHYCIALLGIFPPRP